MKYWFLITAIYLLSCSQSTEKASTELISDVTQQSNLFVGLKQTTNDSLPTEAEKDSAALLLLPLEAICPSCRNKIIDSIASNQAILDENHFIILSASGGKKTIGAFFRDRGHPLPSNPGKIFLDSVNKAGKLSLFTDKPVFFYADRGKVYKKVSSLPATVKQDLHEFFEGCRTVRGQMAHHN